MKKLILVLVVVFLFAGSLAYADKVVNPNQGWRDGLRAQGDTCENPLFPVVGTNYAPYAPVWYEYTPGQSGTVTISSCIDGQSVDTWILVYDACGGSEIISSDDIYCEEFDYASELSFDVVQGVSYQIKWSDYWMTDSFTWTLTETTSIPGASCEDPLAYYNINDPAQTGSIISGQVVWYEFYLDGTFTDVSVSLCGSDFDTFLNVYDECGAAYIGSNDDYCGIMSQVDFAELAAGTYYAEVMGYYSSYGNYELVITGVPTGLPAGDVIANAIPVEFDAFNYFNDTGDLSLYADDYDLPVSDGADVVYTLTLGMGALVDVSLLNSDYDTKVAVYSSDVIPGPDNYLFYNDDFYSRLGANELTNWARPVEITKENSRVLQSALYDMPLDAGTYYIIIDGFNCDR